MNFASAYTFSHKRGGKILILIEFEELYGPEDVLALTPQQKQ